ISTVSTFFPYTTLFRSGWFANGVLERRSVRRRMRIDYLLAAYSDLDEAGNRTMTVDHESAIERAIAQIQLLGTRQQVQLADDFRSEEHTSELQSRENLV